MAGVQDGAVAELRAQVKGVVILPGEPGYDDARKVWNAMIDRKPALIVRCQGVEDVVCAVNFSRRQDLRLSIRGGGHNIAGNAVCDDGVMIDLSSMRIVCVEAETKRAYVEPGATLADFDAAAQMHGLATPLGINSTTGVAGLTLGGGFGWLTRKYGLTIDNLESADMVTAAGEVVRASAQENPDLFWAIRGGGGNFGVVTRFEFRLHAVGPEVLSGLFVFPFAQARELLMKYREFTAEAPEELNLWTVLRKAPPLPFLPQEVHGKEVVIFPFIHIGDREAGARAIEAIRNFGQPHGEHVGPMPYSLWQKAFDPLLAPGARNYWKSHNFTRLADGAIDTMIDYASKLPNPQCEIFVGLVSGEANRVPQDATAYAGRDANYVLNVHGRWDSPSDDQACIAWAREFFAASAPFATGGVYVNFLSQDETDRVQAAYGANFARLAELKAKYDPANFFRLNQNIKPKG
jgi:FAD/FMN-containing dehydrogenase